MVLKKNVEYTDCNLKKKQKWYTDGSKTNTEAGAVIYGKRTKCASSGSCMNVLQAEILAIEGCIYIILKKLSEVWNSYSLC